MLNVEILKMQIADAIKEIIVPAIETIELNKSPKSKRSSKISKETAEKFDELVTLQFADVIANAIDSYIKNMNITGTVITNGGPTTQTANITAAPTPIVGGVLPNTFGIH